MRWPALLAILVLSATALAGCGSNPDPCALDTDGDGLQNCTEDRGWDFTIDMLGRRVRDHASSDPNEPDTDRDGLADGMELQLGLNPRSPDTDADGLSDCQEAYHSVRSDCQNPQRLAALVRARGLDGGYGTDARNADSDPGGSRYYETAPYRDDTGTLGTTSPPWGDGVPDGSELAGYNVSVQGETRLVHTDPMRGDTDGDGLDDGEEAYLYRSDPIVVDTDRDGCIDGVDVFPNRRDLYDPGLQSFRLKTESSPGSGARLRLTILLYGNLTFVPRQAEGLKVQVGQETALDLANPLPLGPGACTVAPHDPWVLVQIAAADTEGGRVLDIHSESGAGESAGMAEVWWNPREQVLAATRGGLPLPAPLLLSGKDGALRLSPAVQLE